MGSEGVKIVRLNRFLARSGVASRRKSDDLIVNGSVRVNGIKVEELGFCVCPGRDRVECLGLDVSLPDQCEYLLFNKPVGYVVTRSDTHGRQTVFDLVHNRRSGTMPVGRLDMNTTGLLLWTDDGELAHRLLHPRYLVNKVYEAVVRGAPSETALDRLRVGIDLDDGPTAPANVELIDEFEYGYKKKSCVRMCIHEGRKRQVRRMLRSIGHPVHSLKRISFAGLTLSGLAEAQCRSLLDSEIVMLKTQVGLE